jgi:hypothetical protein
MSAGQQIWLIARLELGRVFFSRRSFWVYLLALFPTVLFLGHAFSVEMKKQRWAGAREVRPEIVARMEPGLTEEQVLEMAGKPNEDRTARPRIRRTDQATAVTAMSRRYMVYFDGSRRVDLTFEEGVLKTRRVRELVDFEEDRRIYATMFQFFYLRLAIFFGCLGIFINLFRGEMLDRSLHFWFLAPVKREVLLLGKYCAGLIAAALIFGGGAVLSFLAMTVPQRPAELAMFWQTIGVEHAAWYAAAAVLGCVGYGSVFLAAGLLLRNPIVPAVVILLWESINGFLPEMMQKLSVLHYLQSLCPVPMPMPGDISPVLKLLLAPAAPSSVWVSVTGLLAMTGLVLFAAARAARRLEINYGTE